jgi:hypothetical protein
MNQLSQLDANQITKTVYDPTSGGLRVGPAYVTSTVLLSTVTAGTSATSSSVFFLPFSLMGAAAVWSGLDSTNGTLQFEGSIDNTTWFNIGSAFTLSTASGSQGFNISQATDTYQDLRVVYTHGSNTVGTITVTYVLRA